MNIKGEILQLKNRLMNDKILSSVSGEQQDKQISTSQDAICETTDEMAQGFADIEDAICELTEMISQ